MHTEGEEEGKQSEVPTQHPVPTHAPPPQLAAATTTSAAPPAPPAAHRPGAAPRALRLQSTARRSTGAAMAPRPEGAGGGARRLRAPRPAGPAVRWRRCWRAAPGGRYGRRRGARRSACPPRAAGATRPQVLRVVRRGWVLGCPAGARGCPLAGEYRRNYSSRQAHSCQRPAGLPGTVVPAGMLLSARVSRRGAPRFALRCAGRAGAAQMPRGESWLTESVKQSHNGLNWKGP